MFSFQKSLTKERTTRTLNYPNTYAIDNMHMAREKGHPLEDEMFALAWL